MDTERCIALHNEILQHGWIGSGRNADEFEANCPTWHFYHGTKAEEIRADLTPELFAFLAGARIFVDPDADLHFFYWVDGPSVPDELFYAEEILSCNGNPGEHEKRYVVLYLMKQDISHCLGLIFDQKTGLSILCPSIYEAETILNGRIVWYPLETVLQAWLNMIRKGNVRAVANSSSTRPPWELVSLSEIMLQETIDAFDKLVETIEARMPVSSSPPIEEPITHGLIDEDVLQLAAESNKFRQGRFVFDFLRLARRPRFSLIAPGLEIPTSSTITAQPFWLDLSEHQPFLLFRSKSSVDAQTISCPASTDNANPFFNTQTSIYNAGLYILPEEYSTYADEFRLILPFGIGAQGYARMSDGSLFGENREESSERVRAENTFADLYRPGYQPFEDMRENRLVSVLVNWRKMVEQGNWKVDKDGVANGIDEWREADTENNWEKYLLLQLED